MSDDTTPEQPTRAQLEDRARHEPRLNPEMTQRAISWIRRNYDEDGTRRARPRREPRTPRSTR